MSTYTTSASASYFAAWRFVSPLTRYSTTNAGWIPPITYVSSPSSDTPKESQLPEIDRNKWSDFMDSDSDRHGGEHV